MKRMIIIISASLFIHVKGYSQITGIYTDEEGNQYAVIYSTGLPENRVENRSENSTFYTNIQLYEWTSNGQNTNPVKDSNGNLVYVHRVSRHNNVINSGNNDMKVSKAFIISPDAIDSDGASTTTTTMDWATANGYLATANLNKCEVASYAVPKGCAMYRGKDGKDTPGTWRVPTFREGSLIMIFYRELEETNVQTGFNKFALSINGTVYWLATEYSGSYTNAWYMKFYPDATKVKYASSSGSKSSKYFLRCIRDIPLK
ncbi:DUF1566 domain-containing protein [uncultured Bacteroides sp.]|uniref:DUF1566 domain-containing protein n=1 Tax=uncultured Bacteroides sp. TaxID=162156 RepID=UPI0025D1E087|nr:DUF1566 domain-containing protein [uncultured Bacteroides sp.]